MENTCALSIFCDDCGDFARGHQVDYVLGEWSDEEQKAMAERLKIFGDAILSFACVGADMTMNTFNKK